VEKITRIGMDTSKPVFQLHGVDATERVVLRRKLRRTDMLTVFAACEPTVIGIEACAGSHHWARVLGALGHEVKLLAPQRVNPPRATPTRVPRAGASGLLRHTSNAPRTTQRMPRLCAKP
jgi:transposase